MFRSEKEVKQIQNFNYVMQSFKIIHVNKTRKYSLIPTRSNVIASAKKYEAAQLAVLMRFTKYTINDLKQLFTLIDVESEAARIMANQDQNQVSIKNLPH